LSIESRVPADCNLWQWQVLELSHVSQKLFLLVSRCICQYVHVSFPMSLCQVTSLPSMYIIVFQF
jgi:hypothetical protein